ncbi:transcription initiation factor TFIID component TAF4 family-domain-containing protein [Lentinula aciculospora]|uniref:Transcription initiation factor TFIID subunit 4 n=1 Tax=Lentinula aciculospora TaxID=153920 RepID=A0A9W9A9Y4_9AGAR|nr:transcription initiation factor TFIID component TAF4 family-domain-containing protein [Lentinula aciculospora]
MSQPAKSDETRPGTPATHPTTQQPQPAPTTYSTWANIPIDPALQAQPAPGTSQTSQSTPVYQYSPYSYYQNYQHQFSVVPQTATSTTPTPVVAQSSATPAPSAAANAIDTSDINTLRDALGSTGVDLRAEEESLQRTSDSHLTYRSYEDRTRKQPSKPNFNTIYLSNTILQITTAHKLANPHASADTLNYLALALRARLQDLITAMITAARHRTDTQFDNAPSTYEDGSPMWSILVRSDVAKQLAALEKIEREEETKVRRERKERADMAAAQAAALAAQSANAINGGGDDEDGFGSGGTKKKRKKDGPGVTAKNMSADVQKKMSNAAASHAAGLGGRYAWMTAGASSTSSPAPKKPAVIPVATTTASPTILNPGTHSITGGVGTSAVASTPGAGTSTTTTTGTTASGWARPYVPVTKKTTETTSQESVEEDAKTAVTMRDAMFVIEKERGHGGGRGAAKGWT